MAVGMNFSKIEKTVYDIAAEIAAKLGFFVYDVEYVKESGTHFLRIFVDKIGGISIDECEEFSRAFSDVFDKDDPISDNYFLEVSSPGIERKVRRREHFELNKGEIVDVGLYMARNGSKTLTGELLGLDEEDNVIILADGGEVRLPIKQTTGIKVHFEF